MTGESMVLFLLLEPRSHPCGRIGDSGPQSDLRGTETKNRQVRGPALPGFRQELYGCWQVAARRALPPKAIFGIGRAEIVVGQMAVGDDIRVLVILDEGALVEGRALQVLTRLGPAVILDLQRHIPLAIEVLDRLAIVGRALRIVEQEAEHRTSPPVDDPVRLLPG